MEKTFLSLKKEPLFRMVLSQAKKSKKKIYLVGGIIRDLILGREKHPIDYDFTLKSGSIKFASELANKLKAGFVVLDKEHGSCRIVYNKERYITLDFTDFRGRTLEKDLFKRDFTINCLCINLEQLKRFDKLQDIIYDPCRGLADINKKIIRQVNPKSIIDDPVRIVRAFAFSAIFGFRIDSNTLVAIKKYKANLRQSAFERIRDELFRILETQTSYKIVEQLNTFKILPLIIPEIKSCYNVNQGPYHHLDVWSHSLETLKQLEIFLYSLKRNKKINLYLNQEIAQGNRMYQILKLATLLHDIGKPAAKRRYKGKIIFHGHEAIGVKMMQDVGERLKLSSRETDSLKRIILWHLRPGYMADIDNLSKRAIFRFFRDTDREAVAILLMSVADQRATKGRLTSRTSRISHESLCLRLIKEYFKKQDSKPFARLIDGHDLLKLDIPEGPIIGKILKEIEETQAEGAIRTKKEAILLAKKLMKKEKGLL